MPRRKITWPEHKKLLQKRHGSMPLPEPTPPKGGMGSYNSYFYCAAMAIELALEIHPDPTASRYLQYVVNPPHMFPLGIAESFRYIYNRAEAYHREFETGMWPILSAINWLRYVHDHRISGRDYDPNILDQEQYDYLYERELNTLPTTNPLVMEEIHGRVMDLTYEWIGQEYDTPRHTDTAWSRYTRDQAWSSMTFPQWEQFVYEHCTRRLAIADVGESDIEMKPPPLLEY